MRICILSRDNVPIGYLDNDVPDGMHYYDDKLHVYLTGTAHTFEFTTRATEESAELLAVGNKLAFIYKNRPYYLNIVTTSQDEDEIEVEAWAFCLELLNESANAYEGTSKTFTEYFNAMIYANDMFQIGANEVSDRKRTLSYTSTSETLLKRLYSLVDAFDAEVEFIPELNPDYSLNKILVNVYQEHSDTVQGVGERRTDANYRYGKGVDGITKKQDITNLYTSIRPTGKDNLKITDMESTQVLDDDGNVLYYHTKGNDWICAPQAMEQFPSYVGTKDKYILYNWETNYETQADLYGNALAKLKEISVPDSSYEIKGSIDVNIGDTITVIDESFSPALYLETRVTEQEISFTDSTRNSTTFESTKELENAIDSALVKRVAELETQTAKISTKADEAVVKADSASETASSAVTKADEAVTKADTAATTADAASITATQAADDVKDSVVSSVTEYYLSTSATSQTGGSWSTTSPTWSEGTYVWTRTKTTTKGGTVSYSNAACVTGNTGAQGEQGIQGDKGDTGATGESGTGVLKITTAPASYTTKVGDFTPAYRITLSKVKEQASVTEVKVGDTLLYNYYLYKIGYIDTTYAYTAARTSIRGAQGYSTVLQLTLDNQTDATWETYGTTGYAGTWTLPSDHAALSANNFIQIVGTSTEGNGHTIIAKITTSATATATTVKASTTAHFTATKGEKGDAGEQGYSVAQVTTMYYLSDSGTAQSGGEWTTDMPEWKSGYYLWQKDVTLLSDGSTIMGTPALSNGINSANKAAKTAQDGVDVLGTLIRETTDGVEVAKVDDTGAYTGMRTEQTADAYLIKDKDGNTLASYGADTVELGKGNSASTISLSDGNTQISTYQETEGGITYTYGNIAFPNGNGFVGGANTNAKARLESMITPSGNYAQVGLIATGKETTSSDAQTARLTVSANAGHPLLSLKSTFIDINGASNAFSGTMDNIITSLSNGLGLSNCAFQHVYGIDTATKGKNSWQSFTTTNINVTEEELSEGTAGSKSANFLVLCWARVKAVSGDGTLMLRLNNGGKAIHSTETRFGSGAIYTGMWQSITFATIWYVGERNVKVFNAYPQINSSVTFTVDSCELVMIRLNDGIAYK